MKIQIHNCNWFAPSGRSVWRLRPDGRIISLYTRRSLCAVSSRSEDWLEEIDLLAPGWSNCPSAEVEFVGEDIPPEVQHHDGPKLDRAKRLPLIAALAFCPDHPLAQSPEGQQIRTLCGAVARESAPQSDPRGVRGLIVATARAAVDRLGLAHEGAQPMFWRKVQ